MKCTFPSEELLTFRREMIASIGRGISEPDKIALEMVAMVDRLRVAHEKHSGCKCWYAAVESSQVVTA